MLSNTSHTRSISVLPPSQQHIHDAVVVSTDKLTVAEQDNLNLAIELFASGSPRLITKYASDHGIKMITGKQDIQSLIHQGYELKQTEDGLYFLSRGLEGGGKLDELLLQLETKPQNQLSVFISYKWSQKAITVQLADRFAQQGFMVVRDEEYLKNGVYLPDFMQLVNHRKLDYVIVVVSKDYFESINCMYEVYQATKRHKWQDSVIPLVISEGGLSGNIVYSPEGRNAILTYWQGELAKARTAGNPAEQKKIENIIQILPDFMDGIIKKISTSSPEIIARGFAPLFELIQENEVQKGGAKYATLRELLDNGDFDYQIEDFDSAAQFYAKAIAEVRTLRDTTKLGKELSARAYGSYANCLSKQGKTEEAKKNMKIAQNFGYTGQLETPLVANTNTAPVRKIELAAIKTLTDLNMLVELLDSTRYSPAEMTEAAMTLEKLADDNQVKIANIPGALDNLVTMLTNAEEECRMWAAWVLCSLARNPSIKAKIASIPGALDNLVTMLTSAWEGRMEMAAMALWNLADNDDKQVKIAILSKLVDLLSNPRCRGISAMVLCDLMRSDAENKVKIANISGTLDNLVTMLTNAEEEGREIAAEVLMVIAENTKIKAKIAKIPGAAAKLGW
jgi:tetratricopeptide (TPR) repeat protein